MAITKNGRATNVFRNVALTDTDTGTGSNSKYIKATANGYSYRSPIDSQVSNYLRDSSGNAYYTPGTTSRTPTRSGGGGSYSNNSNYNALWEYFRSLNEQGRQDAINAILARLNTNIDMYNGQMGDVNNEYQKLINQSEVNRYRTKASVREALANRGQLDSGLGRQEQLNLDANYGNQLNSILMERERQRNDIRNKISELKANAEEEKAKVNNQYNEQLLKWQSANAK